MGTRISLNSNPGDDAENAQVAINDIGDIVAAWRETSGDEQIIYARQYINGSWQTPTDLNNNPNNLADYPQAIIDANSNALALWNEVAVVVDDLWNIYSRPIEPGSYKCALMPVAMRYFFWTVLAAQIAFPIPIPQAGTRGFHKPFNAYWQHRILLISF